MKAEEIQRLRERVGLLEQRNTELQSELAEARLAQQQLQNYADDFRRTYTESRQRLQQMTTLYEISTSIGGTVDPQEVLVRTAEGLRRLLPVDGTAVYMLDEDGQTARRRAASWPEHIPAPAEAVPIGEGAVGRSVQNGEAVEDSPHSGLPSAATHSLVLPLGAGTGTFGALLMARFDEKSFGDQDRNLAGMIASQTTMALQNARLATTDSLTNLYNRRYFQQALDFECERAHRLKRPLGLLMIDIDHFKQFNDDFGHLAGDEVLRHVATTLTRRLRRTDILARVGGEEFAVILLENDAEAVVIAAERLRTAMEQAPSVEFEGRELPGVRVSIGGASLTGPGLKGWALVRAADTALLQAKQRGRNQSVVAHFESGEAQADETQQDADNRSWR